MKKIKILLSITLSFLLITQPVVAANTPDSSTLDFFNKNNIFYYNPDGSCKDEQKNCKQNDGSDLTIIGDTLLADESTKAKLMAKFPNLTDDNYDAKVSRFWHEGIEIAKTMSLKNTIIFELGSNNSDGLAQSDIDNLIKVAGTNRTIVLVTNYGTASEYQAGFNNNNNLFKQNAESNKNIIIADWAAKASAEYPNMDSMTVHPADNNARDLLVDVIYDALNTNLLNN